MALIIELNGIITEVSSCENFMERGMLENFVKDKEAKISDITCPIHNKKPDVIVKMTSLTLSGLKSYSVKGCCNDIQNHILKKLRE